MLARWGQTLKGEGKDRAMEVLGAMMKAALPSSMAAMLCTTDPEFAEHVYPLAIQRCDVVVIIKKGFMNIEGLIAKVPELRKGNLKHAS
eukprot:10724160-Lingulodinium_polyedra.AAC.1